MKLLHYIRFYFKLDVHDRLLSLNYLLETKQENSSLVDFCLLLSHCPFGHQISYCALFCALTGQAQERCITSLRKTGGFNLSTIGPP